MAVAGLAFLWERETGSRDENAIATLETLPSNTLAVLPFIQLGGGPERRFVSDGLSEDLTTDLAKVAALTVISHRSSFDYRDVEKGLRGIAEDLSARYLVRGTVHHESDRVRINVALVDPLDGHNLWADRYDRGFDDLLSVQDKITQQIVEALSLELGVPNQPRQRIEPDAYHFFLRGLVPLRRGTHAGNLEARVLFEEAVALDSQYARAHAGIAETFGREVVYRYRDDVDAKAVERGLESAILAIQLDPNIPSAYYAVGVLSLALQKFETALVAARHSIKLNMNYADGHPLLAEVAAFGGDLEEALVAIRKAKQLHPHHDTSYDGIEGQILFQLEKYSHAEPNLVMAADNDSVFYFGPITLAANYANQGKLQEAKSVMRQTSELRPEKSWQAEIQQLHYRFEDRRAHLLAGVRQAALAV